MRAFLRRPRALLACVVIAAATAGGTAYAVLNEPICAGPALTRGGNGVSVDLRDRPPGLSRAVLCVDGRCRDVTERGTVIDYRSVDVTSRHRGPDVLDVVLVLDRDRGQAMIRTTRVRLREMRIAGCDDKSEWQADVVFENDELRPE